LKKLPGWEKLLGAGPKKKKKKVTSEKKVKKGGYVKFICC